MSKEEEAVHDWASADVPWAVLPYDDSDAAPEGDDERDCTGEGEED